MHWYFEALQKYLVFEGRARRKEYWFFTLFNTLITIGFVIIDVVSGLGEDGIGILTTLYCLAIILPSIAVSVRRLHDTGRSGWWLLISWVPLIGGIVLLIFYVQDSDPGPNAYGANPKADPYMA